MSKRDQWDVRLDDYHQFVVRQFMDGWGLVRSQTLERMIVEWVAANSVRVEHVDATMKHWKEIRAGKSEADEERPT